MELSVELLDVLTQAQHASQHQGVRDPLLQEPTLERVAVDVVVSAVGRSGHASTLGHEAGRVQDSVATVQSAGRDRAKIAS